MNNRYDTVFFDWGGVVATDPGDGFLGDLLRSVGATEAQIGEIFKTYMSRFMCGQISEAEYWEALGTKYGLSIPDSISEEFLKWDGLAANNEVLDLVRSLKAQGLRMAVLSNVIEPTYNALSRAGCYDLFDAVIASCKLGLAKPERQIYEHALEVLGTTAAASIFIDDKQRNLDTAEELGFAVVLGQSPEQIVRDVYELVGP